MYGLETIPKYWKNGYEKVIKNLIKLLNGAFFHRINIIMEANIQLIIIIGYGYKFSALNGFKIKNHNIE